MEAYSAMAAVDDDRHEQAHAAAARRRDQRGGVRLPSKGKYSAMRLPALNMGNRATARAANLERCA